MCFLMGLKVNVEVKWRAERAFKAGGVLDRNEGRERWENIVVPRREKCFGVGNSCEGEVRVLVLQSMV